MPRIRSRDSETTLLNHINGTRDRHGSSSTTSESSSTGSSGDTYDSLLTSQDSHYTVRSGSETYHPIPKRSHPLSLINAGQEDLESSFTGNFPPTLERTQITNGDLYMNRTNVNRGPFSSIQLPQRISTKQPKSKLSCWGNSSSTKSTSMPGNERRRGRGTTPSNSRSSSSSSGSHGFISRRQLIVVAMLSLCLSFISFSFMSFFLVTRILPAWQDNNFQQGDQETCVRCDQLDHLNISVSNDPSMQQLSFRDDKNGHSLCCARNSGQMSTLLQMIIQRSKEAATVKPAPEPSEREKFRFSPVSAHKHLYPWNDKINEVPEFGKSNYHVRLSQVNDTIREHVRSVEVRNNSLGIKFTGWYYIYSSIYFKPNFAQPCKQLPYQTFGHYIVRFSPDRPSRRGVLTKTAHTCCDDCKDDHHTSYTGGVFHLIKGEQIYIEVTGKGLILFDNDSNYIGLVMLGSSDDSQESDQHSRTQRSIESMIPFLHDQL